MEFNAAALWEIVFLVQKLCVDEKPKENLVPVTHRCRVHFTDNREFNMGTVKLYG